MKSALFLTLCLLAACTTKQPEEKLYTRTDKTEGSNTITSVTVYTADDLELYLSPFEGSPGIEPWHQAWGDIQTGAKKDSTRIGVNYFTVCDTQTSPMKFKSPADFVDYVSRFGYEKLNEENVVFPNGQSSTRFTFKKKAAKKP